MEQGYAYIQAHKSKPFITEEQLAVAYLKADLALVVFLTALTAIYIGMTDWKVSVPFGL